MLPAAQFFKRAGFPLKKIIEYAARREYSDVMVVNEDRKAVNGLLVVHLPAGPSVHFKLSKLVLGADIPVRPPHLPSCRHRAPASLTASRYFFEEAQLPSVSSARSHIVARQGLGLR